MINSRSTYVSLVLSCGFALSAVPAQESVHGHSKLTVELLLKKFGEPDQRRDWAGTNLDYKLENGQIFTISVSEEDHVWAGLKLDLNSKVGRKTFIRGKYLGPGKEASYVKTDDGQAVYLNLRRSGGTYPQGLAFGDMVTVVGTLEFRPGTSSDRSDVSTIPPLFHIDDPQISLQCKERAKPTNNAVNPSRR